MAFRIVSLFVKANPGLSQFIPRPFFLKRVYKEKVRAMKKLNAAETLS
jgi:hypothetical protein